MDAETSDRAALLITVGAGTVAFTLGFNAGAFNTIFFDVYLSIWVMATAVLAGSLLTKLPPQNWWGRAILLLPTGWIAAAWISGPTSGDTAGRVVFLVAITVAVICLPFIVWILASAINPEFVSLPNSTRIAVVAGVLVFALVGYGIGARNDVFLNCDDFKVSGNDLPANCVSGPNTANPGG